MLDHGFDVHAEVMPSRRRCALLSVVLLVLFAFGLTTVGTDQRDARVDAMRTELQRWIVPDRFTPVGERVSGDLGVCVGAPCLRVTRYFVSDLRTGDACTALEPSLSGWAQGIEAEPTRSGQFSSCGFSGRVGRFQLAVVAVPDRELNAGDGHLANERITQAHQSVMTVSLVSA